MAHNETSEATTISEPATHQPEVVLKDPKALTNTIVRALLPLIILLFPVYKLLKQYGPPSLYGEADIAAGSLALIIPAIYTFIYWTSLSKQALKRWMTVAIALLSFSFAVYLFLSFAFIHSINVGSNEGTNTIKIVGGYALTPQASRYISENPKITINEVLMDMGLRPDHVWEPQSISIISVLLYSSWILTLASLSLFMGTIVLSLPRHVVRSFFLKPKNSYQSKELERVIERVEREPEKAKPAWDLARVKLELYFDRNLSQINYIFWLSVLVMFVGFGFILYGIRSAFDSPQSNVITPAVISGLAGVVTEFIGATFLFLYRSTIQQATSNTQTLERINSVGMAMQILDSISSDSKELQDVTKAEIVKILLLHPSGINKGTDVNSKPPTSSLKPKESKSE